MKIKLKTLPSNLKEHFLLEFINKLNPNLMAQPPDDMPDDICSAHIESRYEYEKKMLKYIQDKFDDIYLDLNKESIKNHLVIPFIHKQTNIDLIGQQIENNCFDWFKNSKQIPQYCPKHFNSEKYNQDYAFELITYQPKLFDSDKFNQEKYSYLVAMYCPEYFDVEKYNQDKYSEVAMAYVPELVDNNKINKNINFKQLSLIIDKKYDMLYSEKEKEKYREKDLLIQNSLT